MFLLKILFAWFRPPDDIKILPKNLAGSVFSELNHIAKVKAVLLLNVPAKLFALT